MSLYFLTRSYNGGRTPDLEWIENQARKGTHDVRKVNKIRNKYYVIIGIDINATLNLET